ncbi:MAG TPA: serine/threonine-protein kinase [Phycisphaerales bacterium]|nr:serine/threonine-protein kinase [Phycisphaerales bacterium]
MEANTSKSSDGTTGSGGVATSLGVSEYNVPAIEGYELVRCIGRGGMGVVYEGRQLATDRRVAIKFLLEVGAGDESIRTRFEREVSVVARLEHDGIVRIIDSGVRRGSYYYVMDFVQGSALDEALKPGTADVDAAVRMIAMICDAVDYAHQRGVLHRDLKPGNVIVDASGKPRLLDFGVAKTMDDTGTTVSRERYNVTGQGQIIGTVAYMPPEQANGDASMTSMRSDVYSLGVMLYELLAGQLPIEPKGSLRDILTAIAEKDPPAPSVHRRQVSKDLDAVVLKCLEKKPQNRYATAGEFAADLRLYLAREPVSARRLTPAGRFVRWCARNKTLTATVSIASLVLLVTSATLVTRVVIERNRANASAAEAKAYAEELERKVQLANDSIDSLKGVFSAVSRDEQGDTTVSKMLDAASARLEKNPPKSPLTEAATRELFGSVYTRLGNYKRAEETLRKALAIREAQQSQGGVQLTIDEQKAMADCLHELGASLYWQGRYSAAIEFYRRSLAIRQKVFVGDHRELAQSLTHLGACNLAMGNHAQAHELYTQALEMRRKLYGDEHEEIAQSLNNLAKSAMEAEDYERAESLFRQSLALIIKLRGEQFVGTSAVLQNLGRCLLDRGDAKGATATFERSLAVRRAMFPKGHPSIAATLAGLSRAALASGDTETALNRAKEAIAICDSIKDARALPEAGEAFNAAGQAYLAMGDAPAAMRELVRARDVLLKVEPPPELELAQVELDVALAASRAKLAVPPVPSESAAPSPSEDVPTTIARALTRMQIYRSPSSRTIKDAFERVRAAGFDPAALPVVTLPARE